ncbi:hypothetical protein HELRODRAFT_191555 [Helobdella robusta]|uniref:Protein Wnt n=1 Tax=Helobdella robusta TaxID=6412 RepID=T1FT28_HELRO|nr:hypothetical protein HELRODRAFT_191555 [Helobdella robusta]ESO05021.1 hypothetical protein HELRODRAFT_191555 [Helobdella robusta]
MLLLLRLLLLLLLLLRAVAKRRDPHWNRTWDCTNPNLEGLLDYQKKICIKNLDLMSGVVHASLQTAQTCQELFIDSRWNCSNILQAPRYMPDLTGGSREQAVVYALASASLVQSIAKTCSSGYSTKCSCGRHPFDEPPATDFKWGGCGDDVRFSVDFSHKFTDKFWQKKLKEKKLKKLAMINLHNNRVGRQIMSTSLGTSCKCHGVSGSCSVKTCWKSLPDLKTIGALLVHQYAIAVEVDLRRPRVKNDDVTVGGKRGGRSGDKQQQQMSNSFWLDHEEKWIDFDYGGEEALIMAMNNNNNNNNNNNQNGINNINANNNNNNHMNNDYNEYDYGVDVRVMKAKSAPPSPPSLSNKKNNKNNKNKNNKNKKDVKKVLVPILPFRKNFSENDLLFITKSPDYCLPEPSLGSIGTKGRECSRTEDGSGGCKSMCCGRGFTSEEVEIQYRCDCKYYWCCYVKCKTCYKVVEINRCR